MVLYLTKSKTNFVSQVRLALTSPKRQCKVKWLMILSSSALLKASVNSTRSHKERSVPKTMRFQNTPYWGHFRKPPFSSPFYFTCYCGWYADTHRKVNSFFLLFPLSFPLNIVRVAIFSDVLTKTTETLHTWINQSYSLVEANSRLIGSAGSFLTHISFFPFVLARVLLKTCREKERLHCYFVTND